MQIIYRNSNFEILKTRRDYTVRNLDGEYSHHSHFDSVSGAKMCIHCMLKEKLPKSPYIIEACIRLSTNPLFKQKLQQLLETKQNRKLKYMNSQKGLRKRA